MPGPQDPHATAVRGEGQVSQRREHLLAHALGHEHLLDQLDHGGHPRPGQDEGPPGDPQADPDGRLGRAVAGDVADHRVDGTVGGLDNVVEVAAEQRLVPAWLVAGHYLHPVGAQQRRRQEPALQPRVLFGSQRADLQCGRRLLGVLALGGVADRPAEDVRRGLSLDQVVLRARRDGREPGALLGKPGQHHDRRAGGGGQHLGDGLQALGVGQAQVQQDAAGDAIAAEHPLRLSQRRCPGQGRPDAAVGQEFLDQDDVPRVVLDQQQRLGVTQPGRAQLLRRALSRRVSGRRAGGGRAGGRRGGGGRRLALA